MAIDIPSNNLYTTGSIIEFEEGDMALVRDKLVIEPNEQDSYHLVREGERIDQIAYKNYSKYVIDSTKYWWIIADANGIHNPLDLTEWVGTELLIPHFPRIKIEL